MLSSIRSDKGALCASLAELKEVIEHEVTLDVVLDGGEDDSNNYSSPTLTSSVAGSHSVIVREEGEATTDGGPSCFGSNTSTSPEVDVLLAQLNMGVPSTTDAIGRRATRRAVRYSGSKKQRRQILTNVVSLLF